MTITPSSASARVSSIEATRLQKKYEELENNHKKIREFVIREICDECREKLRRKLEEAEE